MRDHQLDVNADCVDLDEDEDEDENEDDDRRVAEWEDGLPAADDLTPLTQLLIPSELASAFRITPEPSRTAVDVHRASEITFSSLLSTAAAAREGGGGVGGDESSPRSSKKPRLVWTPELHKRFVEVVAHLGLKNAVPKTIMQLMNVEGLTRENVASHLQKYRLYVKRMHAVSDDVPLVSPTAATPTTGGGSRDTSASGYAASAPGLAPPYALLYGDNNRFGAVVAYPTAHPPQHGRRYDN